MILMYRSYVLSYLFHSFDIINGIFFHFNLQLLLVCRKTVHFVCFVSWICAETSMLVYRLKLPLFFIDSLGRCLLLLSELFSCSWSEGESVFCCYQVSRQCPDRSCKHWCVLRLSSTCAGAMWLVQPSGTWPWGPQAAVQLGWGHFQGVMLTLHLRNH